MTSLNKTLGRLEINIDDGEQYSRRMCLRTDGIDLKSDENENSTSCMEKVQKVFKEMGVQVPAVSIDRAHRIGKRVPASDEKGRKIIGQDHQQMIAKFNINWGSRMVCYNNRKKLKDKRVKIDLTKRRLTLLNQARAKTSGKPTIDFVFADVNCRLHLRTKSGYFYSFDTMGELNDILTEIEEKVESVSK